MLFVMLCFIHRRAPIFTEEVLGEDGEGQIIPPPERPFWAKYVSILKYYCCIRTNCAR
ncbi:hypothetical protein WN943_003282 [Citrus x changshan-huyou]